MIAPQDFQQLRTRIAEANPELPRRLRQAAAYVIAHPDEVALGTTTSVAERAEVQASTLVRFAQAIGFAGFTDLQMVLRSHLRNRLPDYPERLRALQADAQGAEGVPHLLAGFSDAAIDSLRRLRDRIPKRELESAIEKLARARTIYLAGQRRSFGVVHYLAYSLAQMRLAVALIDNVGGIGPEQSAAIGPKDALIAISFAPYAPLTLEAALAAKRAGAELIAISDSVLSPLAQAADVHFEVVEQDFGAFRTLAATHCLAMTLAVGAAERRAAIEAAPKRRA